MNVVKKQTSFHVLYVSITTSTAHVLTVLRIGIKISRLSRRDACDGGLPIGTWR